MLMMAPQDATFYQRYCSFFFALAILCVAIPGIASIKALAIVLAWCYWLAKDNFKIWSAIWFLSVLLNLQIWACVSSIFHAVVITDVMNHFLRLLLFFLVLCVGGAIARKGSFGRERLDTLIFIIALLMMIFKVAMLVVALSGWRSMDEIQEALGFDSITENIGMGLQRLQFPSDIVTPFMMASYVGGKSKIKDVALLLSATIVIWISFSRYLFAFYLLSIFIRTAWIRKRDIILIFSIAIIFLSGIVVSDTIIDRFSGEATRISDEERTDQIRHIKDVISDYPLFGTGIGSSVSTFKRSEKTPYFYEVQWYAMTMQLGYIGIIWFIANLLVMLFASAGRKNILLFMAIFAGWMASGLTNPYLTGTGSSFGLCILLFRSKNEDDQDTSTRQSVEIANIPGSLRLLASPRY